MKREGAWYSVIITFENFCKHLKSRICKNKMYKYSTDNILTFALTLHLMRDNFSWNVVLKRVTEYRTRI